MEDAHISVSPLKDKTNSVFGVFDGHGGNQLPTQAQKYPPSYSVTLLNSLRKTRTIRKKIMNWHSEKHSSRWMTSLYLKLERRKLLQSKNR